MGRPLLKTVISNRYACACALAVAMTIPLVICRGADKEESSAIKAIVRIRRSIIAIACVTPGTTSEIVAIMGSGFFTDNTGRFVTAGHVLDGWDRVIETRHKPCVPAILLPSNGWQKVEATVNYQSFTFVNCYRETNIDLAVCQTIENPFTSTRISAGLITPAMIDAHDRQDGSIVYITGFPLEIKKPVTSKGILGGHFTVEGTDIGYDYFIDTEGWPGLSGGPVYTSNGLVIGVVLKGGRNEGSGMAIARSGAVIIDFLSRNATKKQ